MNAVYAHKHFGIMYKDGMMMMNGGMVMMLTR